MGLIIIPFRNKNEEEWQFIGNNGFQRSIHNIQNSPFRTKFEKDIEEFEGNLGIGCISDNEAQPLLVNSHLGSFAISTVGTY